MPQNSLGLIMYHGLGRRAEAFSLFKRAVYTQCADLDSTTLWIRSRRIAQRRESLKIGLVHIFSVKDMDVFNPNREAKKKQFKVGSNKSITTKYQLW